MTPNFPVAKNPKLKFKRSLGTFDLVIMGFGNTIGAGVFTLTGLAAQYAGPAVFISFIISGCIALLTALVYAEFAGRMPQGGSGYAYMYAVYGELPAWVVGWNLNLRYGASSCA